MNDNFLFILNPISGTRKYRRNKLRYEILKEIRSGSIKGEIRYSKYEGHASQIAKDAVAEGFGCVVVAGGDGSINEVARELAKTNVAIGIIPTGSGNGLAHYLNIPFKIKDCLKVIKNKKIKQADIIEVDDKYVVSIAGIGFDAVVAEKYSRDKGRGFFTYAQSAITEFFKYKPERVKIIADNFEIDENIFFMIFANSNQFGYNLKIAPNADLFDGYIDVVILKNVPLIAAPLSSIKIILGRADKCVYISSFKTKQLQIIREKEGIINIDGDPYHTGKIINVKIQEKTLGIIVP